VNPGADRPDAVRADANRPGPGAGRRARPRRRAGGDCRTGPWLLLLLPLLFLSGVGSWLAVIDLRTHRLPDRIVLPAYPVLAALPGVAAVGSAQPARLGGAVLGGLAAVGGYVGLALVGPPGGLGLGDVKLAGLLSLVRAGTASTRG
jgi:prepilin signal peptidase PulO-like enzyme (type II secretory pathway)